MIQQNRRKKCQNFKNNPCPQYYRSTEAYKYPGCYKLTKDETTLGDYRFNLSRFTDIPNTATVSSNKDLCNRVDHSVFPIISSILAILFIITGGLIIKLWCIKNRRKTTAKHSLELNNCEVTEKMLLP